MSLPSSSAAVRTTEPSAKLAGFRSSRVLARIIVAALAIAAVIGVFTWFPDLNAVFIRADSDVPLNILNTIGNATSIFSSANFGSDNARLYPVVVPYIGFWYVLRHVFHDGVIQYFWWTALIVAGIFGVRFFLEALRMPAARSPFAMSWAVILFSFNAYSALSFATGHDVLYLAYVAAPWMLGFGIRGARTGRWRDALLAGAISAVIAGGYSNPPIVVTALVLPAIAWGAFVSRRHLRTLLRFAWRFTVVAAVLNAWWLLPFVRLLVIGSGAQTIVPPDQHFDWPNFTNPIESHFTLFGLGYWGFFTGVGGHPYFPTAAWLWNPLALVGYAMAIALAVYGTYRGRRRELAVAIPALLLFVIGLFGSKANNDPFGGLGMWFFQHIPGFWIFRSAYEKFGATSLIGLCVAAAIGFSVLERRFRTDAGRLLLWRCVAICALAGIAYPFLSGTIVKTDNPTLGYTAFSHIPHEYDELYAQTRRLPEGRILVLPGVEYGRYVWGAATGDLLRHYLGQDYLEDSPGYVGSNIGRTMVQRLDAVGNDFPYLARIAHVRYVLVRGDVDLGQFGYHTPLSDALQRLHAYVRGPIYTDAYFKLYALDSEPLPKVYLARNAWLLRPGTDVSGYDPTGRTAIVSGDTAYPSALLGPGPVRDAVDDWCGRQYRGSMPYCDRSADEHGRVAAVPESAFSSSPKSFQIRMLPQNGADLTGFSSEQLQVPAARAARITVHVTCESDCMGGIAVSEPQGVYRHYHALAQGARDYIIVLAPQRRDRTVQVQADAQGPRKAGDLRMSGTLEFSIPNPPQLSLSVLRPFSDTNVSAYAGASAMPLVSAPSLNGTPLQRNGASYTLPSPNGVLTFTNSNGAASLLRIALSSGGSVRPIATRSVFGAPFAWQESPWTFIVVGAKQTVSVGIHADASSSLIAQRVDAPVPAIRSTSLNSQIDAVDLEPTWYGYRVHTAGTKAGLLVLSDSFDGNWQVLGADARHVVAQLYANGWELKDNHPEVFSVVYWGRVLQAAGLAVTVLGVLILSLILWTKKRALQS